MYEKAYLVNMKRIRESAGISRKKIAGQLGMSVSCIGLIETSQRSPNLGTALKIANALNVSIYALVNEIEYPPTELAARSELTKARQRLSRIKQLAEEFA